MINKIKLDWYEQKQFLGEILSDLEYWNFEYEVTMRNGTITIEIYGAGKQGMSGKRPACLDQMGIEGEGFAIRTLFQEQQ